MFRRHKTTRKIINSTWYVCCTFVAVGIIFDTKVTNDALLQIMILRDKKCLVWSSNTCKTLRLPTATKNIIAAAALENITSKCGLDKKVSGAGE